MTTLASATLIAVVRDTLDRALLDRLLAALEPLATDFDCVLVANAVPVDVALSLKALVDSVPDTTVVFLGQEVHDDVARLVGVDHAVGDAVLFSGGAADEPDLLPRLFEELRAGYDLVTTTRPGAGARRPGAMRALFPAYARAYAAMTGVALEDGPTGLRVLSRAAALFIAGRPNAELMLRARVIGNGFPAASIPAPAATALGSARRGRSHSWVHALGLLLSVSALPLRAASYTALFGGALSVLYSVYVVAIYLFKRDVAAGWATISLQIAAMMFIFSFVLLFLSEYVIQIHSASPPRNRRYLVVRELRSPLSRRSLRLNLIDGEGRFQLGRPGARRESDLIPRPLPAAEGTGGAQA